MTYIQRIKTFTATSIAKLSEDEVKYVASKVREHSNSSRDSEISHSQSLALFLYTLL